MCCNVICAAFASEPLGHSRENVKLFLPPLFCPPTAPPLPMWMTADYHVCMEASQCDVRCWVIIVLIKCSRPGSQLHFDL